MSLTPISPAAGGVSLTPLTPGSSVSVPRSGSVAARARVGIRGGAVGSVPQTPNTPASGLSQRLVPQTPQSGSAPRRRELGNNQQILVGGVATPQSDGANGETYVQEAHVWGTNVSIESTSRAVRKFYDTFYAAGDRTTPLYHRLLREVIEKGENNLNLNTSNIFTSDPQLYSQLITYPQDIIPVFDMELNNLRMRLENPDNDPEITEQLEGNYINCRPFNLHDVKNMRELNPEDMDSLVSIKGMVIRCAQITPEMQRGLFECNLCGDINEVPLEDGVINEPVQCQRCQSRYSYRLIHNLSIFNDKQRVKVQETPDSIPEGETPHSLQVYVFDDLVDYVKPGDRVEITGIYKAIGSKVHPKKSAISTIYKTYIDAIHFKKTDVGRLMNDVNEDENANKMQLTMNEETGEMTEQLPAQSVSQYFDEGDATSTQRNALEERIKKLSQDPNIYDKLTRSLAPSIWELEDVKKGILCLLFGGSGAERGAKSGQFRGEINVLMCGDPGTSKSVDLSQLLQYVHKIAPRGIYTSGKGSSAVGLTASVVRDGETNEMILESGALVLSDRGVCCIDEFDKMNDSTRSILHEVMEQQTVSIAKAGIVCTLNARTSILASANPKESRYNPKLSVVENVQIMPTLLSRFDLIYLVLDQPNESKDRKLAKHLVSLYHEEIDRSVLGEIIDMELLTQYISYARKNIHPKLTPPAEDKLIEFYTNMRAAGMNQKTITATPRQLEALIRLSEALAKMKLSEEVTEEHVYEAKRLMDVATQRAATDPTTGRIDMDLLQTGHSSNERAEMSHLGDVITEMLRREAHAIRDRTLLERINQTPNQRRVDMQTLQSVLSDLVQEGSIKYNGSRDGMVRLQGERQ